MTIECKSLAEVRENIDRLDRQIIPLLAERSHYVAQAAGFKPQKNLVVDPARIEEVILKVRHRAVEEGMDPDLAENIYRSMIDAFIIFESKVWKAVHAPE